MIQRIQTIFLLLAAGASFGLLALPFASTTSAMSNTALFADGVYNVQDSAGMLAFFCGAGALALIAMFLFRNRGLQMRLTIFAFIANLLGIVFGVLYFMQNAQDIGDAVPNEELGVYLPILTIIFTLLAYRFIRKDEKLVKSMDRLR
jgi:divalent metal cation (Fe/Co/Zn/Cd) transporter